MKNVSFSHLVIILCFIGLFSCGSKDDDPGLTGCSIAWGTELQKELSAITTAALNYSTDDSAENCTALKAAYQGYINALKPYGGCATLTGINRTNWEKAVKEAEAEIATIC